jgi:ribulose-5-phosphate 4-epimerase/fuculose-1-phosphate aldolase
MILRNHGLLVTAETVPDAFLQLFMLQRACEIQVLAQSGGEATISVNQQVVEGIDAQSEIVLEGMGGDIAWPALMRKMDRLDSSYKT